MKIVSNMVELDKAVWGKLGSTSFGQFLQAVFNVSGVDSISRGDHGELFVRAEPEMIEAVGSAVKRIEERFTPDPEVVAVDWHEVRSVLCLNEVEVIMKVMQVHPYVERVDYELYRVYVLPEYVNMVREAILTEARQRFRVQYGWHRESMSLSGEEQK